MSAQTTGQLVKSYFASTRAMDLEGWLGHFAPDAVSYDPVGGVPLAGHADLRAFFLQITGAFETVGLSEESVFLADGRAAVKWIGKGIGKNGRSVTFEGIDVFELNAAGKIQTLWAYWDPQKALSALAADR